MILFQLVTVFALIINSAGFNEQLLCAGLSLLPLYHSFGPRVCIIWSINDVSTAGLSLFLAFTCSLLLTVRLLGPAYRKY